MLYNKSMESIISKANITKIEGIRKYVLKVTIWLLVGGVVLGALMILLGGTSSGEIIGKFMGTMFIVALMMAISVNNFKRISSEDGVVQIFALVGLVSNIAWALLWILLCWQPELAQTCISSRSRSAIPMNCNSGITNCEDTICGASILMKFALAFSCLSALGLAGSNILVIYEGDKKNLIRPLKITSVVCATYEFIYFTIMTFIDYNYSSEFAIRLGMLAGFAGFAWVAVVLAALIISSNEKNRKEAIAEKREDEEIKKTAVKSEAELRAEIEEKVRREMIEKEVRAKVEAERVSAGDNGESKGDSDAKRSSETAGSEKIIEDSFKTKE